MIFSCGDNRHHYAIGKEHGYLYGSTLPRTLIADDLFFADQNWKKPQKDRYIQYVARAKPFMATALDWESHVSFDEVLHWCELLAPHVNYIVIIPKIPGTIHLIPEKLFDRKIILGYSVPTRYGSTEIDFAEFGNRPVHLLGGSPRNQLNLLHHNIFSIDGNYLQMKATRFCSYWSLDGWKYTKGEQHPVRAALSLSLKNYMQYVRTIVTIQSYPD